jgi:hypothetical protein
MARKLRRRRRQRPMPAAFTPRSATPAQARRGRWRIYPGSPRRKASDADGRRRAAGITPLPPPKASTDRPADKPISRSRTRFIAAVSATPRPGSPASSPAAHGFSHAPFALNVPFAPQSDTPDHYTRALRDAQARPAGLSAPHPSHPAERTAPRHTPPIALPSGVRQSPP